MKEVGAANRAYAVEVDVRCILQDDENSVPSQSSFEEHGGELGA
jgi:hypothetical protein